MYTTCMFCHKSLGANDAIGKFPVGRRLAFDAARGRLWVICRACERWNLTPLEVRWEAVEECERQFRSARLRASTDNIGIARLRDGLDLVRIGSPQRPEFAAWRYGDQFGRRRTRAIAVGTGVAIATGSVLAGAAAVGVSVMSLAGIWMNIPTFARLAKSVRLRTNNGEIVRVGGNRLLNAQIKPGRGGEFTLVVGVYPDVTVFEGDEAVRHSRRVVAAINSSGGNSKTVQDAVGELERHGYAEQFMRKFLLRNYYPDIGRAAPIANLPRPLRLALEMALHEDTERRAIEGDLALLEAAWREAEEIAGIADNLLVPGVVERKLAVLKGNRELSS